MLSWNYFSHARNVVIHCILSKLSQIGEISLGIMLMEIWQHAILVCFTRTSSSPFCCGMRTEHRYCLRQNLHSPHYSAQHEHKAMLNPLDTGTGGGRKQKITETGFLVRHQALSMRKKDWKGIQKEHLADLKTAVLEAGVQSCTDKVSKGCKISINPPLILFCREATLKSNEQLID